jgi:hypothetical protein
MSDTNLTLFRAENGPFHDGPDEVYVIATSETDAKQFLKGVDGFAPGEIEAAEGFDQNSIVYDAEEWDAMIAPPREEYRVQ